MLSLYFKPANTYIYAIIKDNDILFVGHEIYKIIFFSSSLYNKHLLDDNNYKYCIVKRSALSHHRILFFHNRRMIGHTVNGVKDLLNHAQTSFKPAFESWFNNITANLHALTAQIKPAENELPLLAQPLSSEMEMQQPANTCLTCAEKDRQIAMLTDRLRDKQIIIDLLMEKKAQSAA